MRKESIGELTRQSVDTAKNLGHVAFLAMTTIVGAAAAGYVGYRIGEVIAPTAESTIVETVRFAVEVTPTLVLGVLGARAGVDLGSMVLGGADLMESNQQTLPSA